MLLNYIRVFTKISSLVDKSVINQDDTLTIPVNLGTSDYIYVAQRFPFTNLFLHMDTVNSNASVLSAQYWDGVAWRDAVDFMDSTSTSGVTMAKSGAIQWSTDHDYTWNKVYDTSDTVSPTELQTLKVYDSYWMRLKVSASISASADVKEICYAFTTSQRLKDFDVELDGYLASFATGKTDWIDEIKTGSKLVIQDLKRLGLIMGPGQVIELDDMYVPTSLRTVALIYSNLGPSYKDKIEAIMKQYSEALNIRRFTFDSNADGKLEAREINGTIKRVYR
jgi:hypothetical protein